jgi:nucleotide-binding universal stress UspA family protein
VSDRAATPGPETNGPARIVVGIDGSTESVRALRWAAQLAAATGATLEAVGAWEWPTSYGWSSIPMDWDPAKDTDKILTAAVDELFGAHRPASLVLTVQEGHAAQVLLTAAEGALLLVVGSRGHGGFAGMLLGSVSTSCTEHATCPVLVMHGDVALPELPERVPA